MEDVIVRSALGNPLNQHQHHFGYDILGDLEKFIGSMMILHAGKNMAPVMCLNFQKKNI